MADEIRLRQAAPAQVVDAHATALREASHLGHRGVATMTGATLSVGVDPGMHGAIALYSSVDGLLEVAPMPTMAIPLAKGSQAAMRRKTDGAQIALEVSVWLRRHGRAGDRVIGVIERMQAYREGGPGASASVSSLVSMSYSAGIIEGAIARLCHEIYTPMAAHWKRRLGLDGQKDSAVAMAERMFHARLSHDRAEAALLALYGVALEAGRFDKRPKRAKKRPGRSSPGPSPRPEAPAPAESSEPPSGCRP